MVVCRSCGRHIVSGAIRCTRCNAPFHLSCSHRYQISTEGVFNICCENQNYSISLDRTSFSRNKRCLQQNVHNKSNSNECIVITEEQNLTQRYGKMVKTEKDVCANGNLIIDNESNDSDDGCEIIEEIYPGNNYFIDLDEYDSDNPNETMNEAVHDETSELISRNNEVNNKITLETVWKGISSLQSSISNISQSLDTVSTQLNTFDPRIKELEVNLNTIKAKTISFDNVQNEVSGLKEEFEQLIRELDVVKTTHKEKNIDLSEIFSEIREREMKSRNIIIYNVSEDNLRLSEDYSTLDDINRFNAIVNARDNSRAREILEAIPNIDLDDLETRRLGRINDNNCRPLRVKLQCRDDVITVMKNRGLISRHYNVKTDLTRMQQKKIRELREELDKTNANKDNPKSIIRFINGEPRIVPIRRNFAKNE